MLQISSLGSPLSIQMLAAENKWRLGGSRASCTYRDVTIMTVSLKKLHVWSQTHIAQLWYVRGPSYDPDIFFRFPSFHTNVGRGK